MALRIGKAKYKAPAVSIELYFVDGLDVQEINRELEDCASEVVMPMGKFLIRETIHIPPQKRLRGHPHGTTLITGFEGPAIEIHRPRLSDPVTRLCIVGAFYPEGADFC